MIVNPKIFQEVFNRFARPITYSRAAVSVPINAFVTYERPYDSEVINDFDVNNLSLTMQVKDLLAAGLYPTKKYDKVLVDSIVRNVELERVNYIGTIPVFVRLWAIG